ncbi:hypothetical protein [uncultured Mailhella sp.]|uniref:hypothetical protein n=1 Tax=uncultured Mailhella sp. TaxID=1981031 RepID=UPI0026390C9C|nr:hypothetical protein [uncultured Mailhella sp.]
MSKKKPEPAAAEMDAYKEFQDALKAVITFPQSSIVPGFVTLNVERPIHDHSGNEIPAQLHFVSKTGALYAMTIEGHSDTGLKGQLVRYNTTTGDPFTLSNLIGLILADETLAPLIDAEAASKALAKLEGGEDKKDKASPRSAAIEKGALMTLGGHIASYSTDDLKNALNGFSIMRLPDSVKDPKDVIDEATGKLNMLMLQDKALEGITTIHTAFLMAIVQAVSSTQGDDTNSTITLYLPAICRELKIDPRTYSNRRRPADADELEQLEIPGFSDMRLNAVMDILRPFDPLVGRTPDGSYYRLLTFISYEADSETLTVSTPYLFKLKALSESAGGAGGRPALNRLLRGEVVNEPNRAAVELANRILYGIVRRGIRPDYKTYVAEPKISKKTVRKKGADGQSVTTTTVYDTSAATITSAAEPLKIITYKVKYSTLIDDCPQLRQELEAIEAAEPGKIKHPAQAYNSKLKNVFEAAFRIIAEKSDAPARYLDFTLPTTTRTVKGAKRQCYEVPTKSTLSRNMIITHKGRNPHFAE